MSMNILLEATRDIVVVKTGETRTQTIDFECWQTPTKITHQILESSDPLQTYQDWVMSNCEDESWPIYADDDPFHTGPVIDHEIYNPGREHISQMLMWIDLAVQEGYTIRWSMI